MDGSSSPRIVWLTALGGMAVYLTLFAFRRDVSFRFVRGSWLAAGTIAARSILVATGRGVQAWEWPIIGAASILLVGAAALRRVWVVRTPFDRLRQTVQEVCRGLFLASDEVAPGRFRLMQRDRTFPLRLVRLGVGSTLIVVPELHGRSKVGLFLEWLRKRFPGPVPRPRIVLTREE